MFYPICKNYLLTFTSFQYSDYTDDISLLQLRYKQANRRFSGGEAWALRFFAEIDALLWMCYCSVLLTFAGIIHQGVLLSRTLFILKGNAIYQAFLPDPHGFLFRLNPF